MVVLCSIRYFPYGLYACISGLNRAAKKKKVQSFYMKNPNSWERLHRLETL